MSSSPLAAPERTRIPPRLRGWLGRRLSGPPRGPRTRSFRIAIYQLDRLGDFVLALAAIRRLIAFAGEADTLLVVSTVAAPLARREFPRVTTLVLPGNAPSLTRDLLPIRWRHRRAFRDLHAREVVCLSHHRDLYKSVCLSWLAADAVRQLDHTTYPTTAPEPLCLELEAHRRLVASVTGTELSVQDILPSLASVTATSGDALLVCPLASETARDLPESLLFSALALWRTRSRAPLLLSGPTAAEPRLRQLANELERRQLGPASVAATPTFDAFLDQIAGAGGVLAVESGPAHLATALDKDTCVVVGGGCFTLCMPWRRSARQRHVVHRLPCFGCTWHCTQPAILCLRDIPPAALAAAVPTP